MPATRVGNVLVIEPAAHRQHGRGAFQKRAALVLRQRGDEASKFLSYEGTSPFRCKRRHRSCHLRWTILVGPLFPASRDATLGLFFPLVGRSALRLLLVGHD
jgi:hypothetical protein